MSEYQHYEFRTVNRSLSGKEQNEVNTWSSRGEVTPTSATFVYHYSDFRQNVEKCLIGYFDMMLYVANWGSRRIMFRFPKELVDFKIIAQYAWDEEERDYEHTIKIYQKDAYVVIDIAENLEEGYDDWVEGEGVLSGITGLWTEILNGNYACLYLIWLEFVSQYQENMADAEDEVEDFEEPDVPAGLRKPSAALSNFMDFWGITDDLRAAAAQKSPLSPTEGSTDLTKYIAQLSDAEKNDFLSRFLKEEPFLHAKFIKRLQNFLPAKEAAPATTQRTLSEIHTATMAVTAERKAREEKEAAEKRRLELEAMKNREPQMWAAVWANVLKKTGSGYDHAIRELKDLRDLAQYTGKMAEYQAKRGEIWEQCKNSKAFVERVIKAGL